MTILDLIKKACKNKGVDAKYASRIEKIQKVTKAEDVEPSIDAFKENVLPVITEAEEAAKKEAGKTAGEEAVEAYRKKYNLDENGKPIEKKSIPDTGSKISPEVKALLDAQSKQISELTELVKTNKSSADLEAQKAAAAGLIKDAKIPDTWISRIDFDSETSLEDQVEALGTEYTEIQQAGINEKVKSGEFTPGFTKPTERSEKEWVEVMNAESDEASDPGVVDLGI